MNYFHKSGILLLINAKLNWKLFTKSDLGNLLLYGSRSWKYVPQKMILKVFFRREKYQFTNDVSLKFLSSMPITLKKNRKVIL